MHHHLMRAGSPARRFGLILGLGLSLAPLVAAAEPVPLPVEHKAAFRLPARKLPAPAAWLPATRSSKSKDKQQSASVPADIERGRAALTAAAAQRQAAYKLDGQAREAGLLAAAAAFGQVADDQGLSVDARVEAAFRAGELLRARGQGPQAAQRFGQAVHQGRDAKPVSAHASAATFGARAQLELGHARRRADQLEPALAAYAEVRAFFAGQAKQVGQAAGWRARLLVRDGQLAQAEAEAAVLAQLVSEDPLEAVRCADAVALALAEEGHEDAARRVLTLLDQQLEPLLAEGADARLVERLGKARGALRVTLSLGAP
ncbi:MAG: hypothetical protein DRQ55_07660 [Planctomycetota bacterium]|nr:MAG: hypothetical protein DRQ55_07660 [Planctomycetota bacterium]